MPQTPKYAIQYLAPNDPADIALGTKQVAEGAEAAVDTATAGQPFAVASGHVTITPIPDEVTTQRVTFPEGRFTVAPNVVATAGSGSTAVQEVVVGSADTGGCDIGIHRSNDTNTGINWIAVQMTPSSANG